MQLIRKRLHDVVQGFAWIAAAALVAMTAIIVLNVVARYVAKQPLAGGVELVESALVVTIFFAVAYTESTRGHVTFDEVVRRFPQPARALTISAMYLGAAGYFAVLAWREAVLASSYMSPTMRLTDVLRIPMAPFLFIISFGAMLLSLELLLNCFYPPTLEREKEAEVQQ